MSSPGAPARIRSSAGAATTFCQETSSTAVVYDNGLDVFLFLGRFGHDVVTNFHIGFDTIAFAGGIDEGDVTVKVKGDDVKIVVSHLGTQSILVKGVADLFDPEIDIFYA